MVLHEIQLGGLGEKWKKDLSGRAGNPAPRAPVKASRDPRGFSRGARAVFRADDAFCSMRSMMRAAAVVTDAQAALDHRGAGALVDFSTSRAWFVEFLVVAEVAVGALGLIAVFVFIAGGAVDLAAERCGRIAAGRSLGGIRPARSLPRQTRTRPGRRTRREVPAGENSMSRGR